MVEMTMSIPTMILRCVWCDVLRMNFMQNMLSSSIISSVSGVFDVLIITYGNAIKAGWVIYFFLSCRVTHGRMACAFGVAQAFRWMTIFGGFHEPHLVSSRKPVRWRRTHIALVVGLTACAHIINHLIQPTALSSRAYQLERRKARNHYKTQNVTAIK